MATLTIRNVPPRVVRQLKMIAKRQNASMEQLVRELLEAHTLDRSSVIQQIEKACREQNRRPDASEIDAWIRAGRET